MGFAVKYDQMNAMWYSIQSACAAWNDALVEIGNQVKVLSQTTAMSGQGADNLKNYIAYVHGFAIEALSQVISAQQANSTLYKDGYLNGIDDSLHAVILEDELQDIRYHLRTKQKDIGTIDSCVRSVTAGISDLYITSYEGSQQSDVFYQQGEDYALKLGTDIISYENRCVASNFTETELLIRRLTEYLKENLSRERVFKASFDVQAWIQSEKTAALYEASVAQSKDIESKADVIQAAFEREEGRQEQLRLEYEEELRAQEERQKEATALNWAVAGACAIGSIAAIALTGGAATPLVVAGVSAVSGAIVAGTNAMTSQYVATGAVTDWGSVVGSTVMGGITGFVTGYIGAGLGNAITSGMQNTVLGQTLTNSSSRLIRMGTYGTINSVSEMGSGVVSRGAATLVSGGSLDEAWDSAVNLQNILVDGVTGFAFGSIQGYNKPVHIQEKTELPETVTSADETETFKPFINDETLNKYLKDIEDQTHREIPDIQKEKVIEAIHSNKYEKLSAEATRNARAEFNSEKAQLISEWQEKTGNKWPTYSEDVFNSRGKVIRREGANYDAHHIIECSYGGPAEWWNITPARFPTEHQQGIHRAGSPASSIFLVD